MPDIIGVPEKGISVVIRGSDIGLIPSPTMDISGLLGALGGMYQKRNSTWIIEMDKGIPVAEVVEDKVVYKVKHELTVEDIQFFKRIITLMNRIDRYFNNQLQIYIYKNGELKRDLTYEISKGILD